MTMGFGMVGWKRGHLWLVLWKKSSHSAVKFPQKLIFEEVTLFFPNSGLKKTLPPLRQNQ